MTLRPLTAVAVLAALVAALFAGAAASPAVQQANASACSKWGKTSPKRLQTPQARKAVLCLINKERKRRGLPEFDRDKRLQKAAQRHNKRMHGTGCFAHQCPGEPDLGKRLERVDYLGGGLSRWAYGENVAWGTGDRGSAKAIVNAWMGSPPHRANILSRDFRDIGIGFSAGTPQSRKADGGIFTTDFGLRVG